MDKGAQRKGLLFWAGIITETVEVKRPRENVCVQAEQGYVYYLGHFQLHITEDMRLSLIMTIFKTIYLLTYLVVPGLSGSTRDLYLWQANSEL